MPHASTAPRSTRFFARLERFEAECPHCGKLIYAQMQQRPRSIKPRRRIHHDKVWNPATQRLQCPHCAHAFMAGLIVYSIPPARRLMPAPPDVVPTAREWAMIRQRAQGWWAAQTYERGQDVNVAVASPCSCGDRGWNSSCAVHGDPAELAPSTA